jgi:hypothetical protein
MQRPSLHAGKVVRLILHSGFCPFSHSSIALPPITNHDKGRPVDGVAVFGYSFEGKLCLEQLFLEFVQFVNSAVSFLDGAGLAAEIQQTRLVRCLVGAWSVAWSMPWLVFFIKGLSCTPSSIGL